VSGRPKHIRLTLLIGLPEVRQLPLHLNLVSLRYLIRFSLFKLRANKRLIHGSRGRASHLILLRPNQIQVGAYGRSILHESPEEIRWIYAADV
jgi:hypothetical protein